MDRRRTSRWTRRRDLPALKNSIRKLRQEREWSQQELAEHLGVSRQTVNALEAGRWDPSLKLALAVAALFDTTVEEIFEPEPRRAAK